MPLALLGGKTEGREGMSEDRKPVDKFFLCACYGEGVRFSYWPEDGYVYLSLWKARSYGKPTWSHRLRHIWRILTDGEPWADEVVLNTDEAKAMGEYLASLGNEAQP